MGGRAMLEDGAELKVVTGIDPENGITCRSFPPAQGRAVRRTRPGVQALWVSAKGAVDNDLVQGALERGELLIVELGDEQL